MCNYFGVDPQKKSVSDEIARLTAAYEAKGGKVTVLPLGHATVSDETREELRRQLNMVERGAGRKGHGETAKGDKRRELREKIAQRRFAEKQARRNVEQDGRQVTPKKKPANPKPRKPGFGFEIQMGRKPKGKDLDANLCK